MDKINFSDRDVICFYGDSITANGKFVAEFYQELKKQRDAKCYNCGISGSNTFKGAKFLYSNCLMYNPDYVFILFGANDVGRYFRSKAFEGTDELREQRINKMKQYHAEGLDMIVSEIIKFGAKPVIVSSIPYDEIDDFDCENLKINKDLLDAIDIQKEIANKYSCPIINVFDDISKYMRDEKIYNGDRIHLNDKGQHVLAQLLLQKTGVTAACDFEKPFAFEEWNELRYEVEHKASAMTYVAFCVTSNGGVSENSMQTQREYVQSLYDGLADKDGDLAHMYKYYLDNIDYYYMYRAEVVRLSK